eukprot:8997784-Pyramimonas_sp.AAC.1
MPRKGPACAAGLSRRARSKGERGAKSGRALRRDGERGDACCLMERPRQVSRFVSRALRIPRTTEEAFPRSSRSCGVA